MRVKESENVALKLNIQKTKIMASGPITSWQIDRGNNGNSEKLYFLGGSQITAHGDCRHEIKRRLLLGKKNTEATVRTGHGTTEWFQIRKIVLQGCILSPCLFALYAEYIM